MIKVPWNSSFTPTYIIVSVCRRGHTIVRIDVDVWNPCLIQTLVTDLIKFFGWVCVMSSSLRLLLCKVDLCSLIQDPCLSGVCVPSKFYVLNESELLQTSDDLLYSNAADLPSTGKLITVCLILAYQVGGLDVGIHSQEDKATSFNRIS